LPGPKTSGRQPVEGRPVDLQAEIGFLLLREAADRGSVEGQVVGALEQELLVVVEHVEAPFEIREADREGFDALLVGEEPDPRLADLAGVLALDALVFGGEVHLLELVVGNLEKVTQRTGHGISPEYWRPQNTMPLS
jgi:hypothetical protein